MITETAKTNWTQILKFWSTLVTMNQLPLNMIRAFALVYDSGGIRPAARRLGIAHSAVSRHVADLENFLDVVLIERGAHGRTISFTQEGEKLGREAMKSFDRLELTIGALRQTRRRNTVVIETTASIASRWLFPRMGSFAKELGWIELSVNTDQRVSTASESTADICLRMGSGPWSGFDGQILIEDYLVPVASREYWSAIGQPKSLRSVMLLHDGDPNARWSLWQRQFGPKALKVDEGPRYTSGDLVLRAAEEGLGVALGRLSLAQASIKSGLLITPFKKKLTAPELRIWLLTPSSRTKTKAVKQTIDWLVRQTHA